MTHPWDGRIGLAVFTQGGGVALWRDPKGRLLEFENDLMALDHARLHAKKAGHLAWWPVHLDKTTK